MTTALDFRDISQHPPSTALARQPLPSDPSWDAHKVLFNEREKDVDKKGDEFDDFFDKQQESDGRDAVAAAALLEATKEESDKANNSIGEANTNEQADLDPLGWPVDEFRTMSERAQANVTNGGVNDDDYNEDGDADDLDLLRRRSDEDGATSDGMMPPSFGGMTLFAQMVEGMDNLFPTTDPESESMLENDHESSDDSEAMGKNDRIRIYETTGVDDESSVEEDDGKDEEEWEKDRDVSYIVQSTSNDEEDMFIPNFGADNVDLIDPENTNPTDVAQFSTETAAVESAALPVFTIPKSAGKEKKKTGPVPLIKPPPPEKLQKWEEARQKLQSSSK